jgi:hypothetical protein
MVTIDDITLPVIASTICKNGSTLRLQKLNNSSAKEPINTHMLKMCNLDARYDKKQISSQLSMTNACISVPTVKEVTAATH